MFKIGDLQNGGVPFGFPLNKPSYAYPLMQNQLSGSQFAGEAPQFSKSSSMSGPHWSGHAYVCAVAPPSSAGLAFVGKPIATALRGPLGTSATRPVKLDGLVFERHRRSSNRQHTFCLRGAPRGVLLAAP